VLHAQTGKLACSPPHTNARRNNNGRCQLSSPPPHGNTLHGNSFLHHRPRTSIFTRSRLLRAPSNLHITTKHHHTLTLSKGRNKMSEVCRCTPPLHPESGAQSGSASLLPVKWVGNKKRGGKGCIMRDTRANCTRSMDIGYAESQAHHPTAYPVSIPAAEGPAGVVVLTRRNRTDLPPVQQGFPMREWSIRLVLIGPNGEEVPANIFDKVTYKLHPTFANPTRGELYPFYVEDYV
jgi:hypothetical protein